MSVDEPSETKSPSEAGRVSVHPGGTGILVPGRRAIPGRPRDSSAPGRTLSGRGSSAPAFFVQDGPKVLLLLALVVFAVGIVPVVQALPGKAAALGTVLAFMMSEIGLSLPGTFILRKVLRVGLIFPFAGVAGGILAFGYAFDALM